MGQGLNSTDEELTGVPSSRHLCPDDQSIYTISNIQKHEEITPASPAFARVGERKKSGRAKIGARAKNKHREAGVQ